MKPFTLPAWTKSLPDNACLDSAEVAKIFGYANKSNVSEQVQRGQIPRPDNTVTKFTVFHQQRMKWSVGYLRKLEKENGAKSK